MELQIFTFFILAFFALTDGVPRKMDGSITMTKPEHAKADLARARAPTLEKIGRQARGGYEDIDTASEEAARLAGYCVDYKNEHDDPLNPHENPYVLATILRVQKDFIIESKSLYHVVVRLKDGPEDENVVFCPFTFFGHGTEGGDDWNIEMLDARCSPPYSPDEKENNMQ